MIQVESGTAREWFAEGLVSVDDSDLTAAFPVIFEGSPTCHVSSSGTVAVDVGMQNGTAAAAHLLAARSRMQVRLLVAMVAVHEGHAG